MKKLLHNPLFIVGLMVRILLIASITPYAVSSWYAPFLDTSTQLFTFDPWSTWHANEGILTAFPYGYVMWLVLLPMTLAAKLLGFPLATGYALTLLIADVGLLLTLHHLLPKRHYLLLLAYWLSPIVILASYGLGLNDLIPALLLTLALFFIRKAALRWAGILCAMAISSKLSMIIALPFFLIYLYHNKALRQYALEFAKGFAIAALVFGAPFLASSNALLMLFSNPEMGKIYQLALSLGDHISIYIVPLIYLILLYQVWQVRRLNFHLFQATIGIAFLLIVLMTPASPGWFVWCIPFLVLYQSLSNPMTQLLISLFSLLYVLGILLATPLQLTASGILDLNSMLQLSEPFGSHAVSLLHTMMVAIGIILALRVWRETISRNDFFRLSRKPFVIGVAGDIGSGKSLFTNAIADLFGHHSTVTLSGNDYHLWDKQKPIWQMMTRRNPMTNDLEGFSNDLMALADDKQVQARRSNWSDGQSNPALLIKSNDFIIANGLHALYLPWLRQYYHLKIFLDMPENLRDYFQCKQHHGLVETFSTLEDTPDLATQKISDSQRFILPQLDHADLVFSLQPIHPNMLEDLGERHPMRLKLVVKTRHGFNELSLNRALIGVCGLHVDIAASNSTDTMQMTIEGEVSAADMVLAAEMLCPHMLDFLDIPPKWHDGMIGLMQLITLSHINQALTRRFVW